MTCPPAGIFNIATSLMDKGEYKNRMRIAKDMLDYKFDIHPNPICLSDTEAFQGFNGPKSIPSALIDIQTYLQQAPVLLNDYLDGDFKNQGPPGMPEILQNKMFIADCKDLIKTDYTPRKRRTDEQYTEASDGTQRVDLISEGRKQTTLFSPGIDTRQQMKDAYKEYEKTKFNGVFGVSKGNVQGDMQLAGDIPCDANTSLDCLHLFGPGATSTSEEGVTGSYSGAPGASTGNLRNINQNATLAQHLAISNGSAPGQTMAQAFIGAPLVTPPATPQSQIVLDALKSIDPKMSLNDYISQKAKKDGCGVSFSGYTSPCKSS